MKPKALHPTIQAMLDARREKIIAARSAGWSVKLIAKEWGVTPARVYQLIDQYRDLKAKAKDAADKQANDPAYAMGGEAQ